jgi:hypothetical protein
MLMDATYPARAADTPKAMRWAGYVLTGLSTAFMLFDAAIKLPPLQVVTDTLAELGYPAHLARPIGIIELLLLALYVHPRTATLGAILLTAVMGGAIASHMRLGDPLFSHTLFGVYLGAMIWGGLWLRDARLRSLVPFRR